MNLVTKIATHLATQRGMSRGAKGCAYRGAGGRRCAVGCLIPNELYDAKTMEGYSVHTLESHIPQLVDVWMKEFAPGGWTKTKQQNVFGVLESAQEYHDNGPYEDALINHGHLSDAELAVAIEQDLREFMAEEGVEWPKG